MDLSAYVKVDEFRLEIFKVRIEIEEVRKRIESLRDEIGLEMLEMNTQIRADCDQQI